MTSISDENVKKKIKSFIYLDEYKMYSISSQIFEGLTEYVTSYSKNLSEDQESQEGPIGSGKVLADIMRRESSTEERRFLHDHSYSLFEEKLAGENNVLQIDSNNVDEAINRLEDYDFVMVRGRLLFNDIKLINETIHNINGLMESFMCIMVQTNEELRQYKDNSSKTKSKGFSPTSSGNSNGLAKLAKELGIEFFDKELLDSFSFILNYGYKDQFEVRTYLTSSTEENYFFSALLKREHLREEENLIVKKYSRLSQKEFVIFGIVTQSNSSQIDFPVANNSSDMKEVLVQLTVNLSNVEKQFIGKLNNEIVIDPIAIYREI